MCNKILDLPNKTRAAAEVMAPLERFNDQIALAVALGTFYQARAALLKHKLAVQSSKEKAEAETQKSETEMSTILEFGSWLLVSRAAKLRLQAMVKGSDSPREIPIFEKAN